MCCWNLSQFPDQVFPGQIWQPRFFLDIIWTMPDPDPRLLRGTPWQDPVLQTRDLLDPTGQGKSSVRLTQQRILSPFCGTKVKIRLGVLSRCSEERTVHWPWTGAGWGSLIGRWARCLSTWPRRLKRQRWVLLYFTAIIILFCPVWHQTQTLLY